MRQRMWLICAIALLVLAAAWRHGSAAGAEASGVALWRLPAGAIQPQAAVDSRGVVHVIYFRSGAAEGQGDLYYIRVAPGDTSPSNPIRVNSQQDTAGCIGTVRTAHGYRQGRPGPRGLERPRPQSRERVSDRLPGVHPSQRRRDGLRAAARPHHLGEGAGRRRIGRGGSGRRRLCDLARAGKREGRIRPSRLRRALDG